MFPRTFCFLCIYQISKLICYTTWDTVSIKTSQNTKNMSAKFVTCYIKGKKLSSFCLSHLNNHLLTSSNCFLVSLSSSLFINPIFNILFIRGIKNKLLLGISRLWRWRTCSWRPSTPRTITPPSPISATPKFFLKCHLVQEHNASINQWLQVIVS